MIDLLIHPKTRVNMETVLREQPNSILITGEEGSGKRTLAKGLASSLAAEHYTMVIDPDENTIKADVIREVLTGFLKLKVPGGTGKIQRVLVIVDANRMSPAAQNALLKKLEEPPLDTMIILTADSEKLLLETTVSRCQKLEVLPIDGAAARDYFSQSSDFSSKYALSTGQVGLLSALINDQAHPLVAKVTEAKQILGQTKGQRLYLVDGLAKDKDAIALLLNALHRICRAALKSSAIQQKSSQVESWSNRSMHVLNSTDNFGKNANSKLLLTDLFINL